MTMPTWDQTMHPILTSLTNGEIQDTRTLREIVIKTFSMTMDEQNEMLKSGQSRIANRVGWGLTDLHKARLIERGSKRGTYRITKAGREFLEAHGNGISLGDLETVPAFIAWKRGYQGKSIDAEKPTARVKEPDSAEQTDEATPEDLMETASEQLSEALAAELLDRIMDNNPYFFERLVTRLVLSLGYGDLSKNSGEVTKKSGDGGIDGVVRLDRLGLDSVYIQAKRYKLDAKVGEPEIRDFIGSLMHNGANKGVFITTAQFSGAAHEYAADMRSSNINVVLIDGIMLAKLMIEYNVGVSVKTVYEVKAIDNDFFDIE